MIGQLSLIELAKQGDSSEAKLSQYSKQSSLLQTIVESFVDGILILTERGEWVHGNERARRICRQLPQETSQIASIPQPIWQACNALIDSRQLFPDRNTIIETEVETDNSTIFRIRVRWLVLEESTLPYLLVTIEDWHQSTRNATHINVRECDLTPREVEVWLLRRANHSYQEIATRLYITRNTVKKHLKNIYRKLDRYNGLSYR